MANVKQTDILTGSIPRQLLAFFLPIWFGTLFQQLYNTADTLIVGNFVGTQALAAVGATGGVRQPAGRPVRWALQRRRCRGIAKFRRAGL